MDAATAAWEQAGDPPSLRALAAALIGAGRAQAAIDLLAAHPAWVEEDASLLRLRAIALSRVGRLADAAAAFDTLASALERVEALGAASGVAPWRRADGRRAAGAPTLAGARAGSAPGAAAGAGATGPAQVAASPRHTAGFAGPAAEVLIASDSAAPPRHTAAWARAEAIECRLRERPPAEAVEALRRLLLVPSVGANPCAVALYGRMLLRAGEPDAASLHLLRASEAIPEDGAIAAAAAFAVRRARGPAAAMPLLVRALRIRSDQPSVLATLVADAVRLRRAARTRGVLIELARASQSPGPLWNAIRRLGAAARGGEAAKTVGRLKAPTGKRAAGAAPGMRASRAAGAVHPAGPEGRGHKGEAAAPSGRSPRPPARRLPGGSTDGRTESERRQRTGDG